MNIKDIEVVHYIPYDGDQADKGGNKRRYLFF